jgi:hypothetical protein
LKAIHNKEHSVVKTFKAGMKILVFFKCTCVINNRVMKIYYEEKHNEMFTILISALFSCQESRLKRKAAEQELLNIENEMNAIQGMNFSR